MKKILLIDDAPENNSNFITTLSEDYEVDITAYLSSAKVKLENSKYNLIVLDIMMPPRELYDETETDDGLRTGLLIYEKELKSLNIPVLFWSWNGSFKEEIKQKNWDKTDFLCKTTDDDHLLKGVKNFCRKLNL